jgi:hypothetical protein
VLIEISLLRSSSFLSFMHDTGLYHPRTPGHLRSHYWSWVETANEGSHVIYCRATSINSCEYIHFIHVIA